MYNLNRNLIREIGHKGDLNEEMIRVVFEQTSEVLSSAIRQYMFVDNEASDDAVGKVIDIIGRDFFAYSGSLDKNPFEVDGKQVIANKIQFLLEKIENPNINYSADIFGEFVLNAVLEYIVKDAEDEFFREYGNSKVNERVAQILTGKGRKKTIRTELAKLGLQSDASKPLSEAYCCVKTLLHPNDEQSYIFPDDDYRQFYKFGFSDTIMRLFGWLGILLGYSYEENLAVFDGTGISPADDILPSRETYEAKKSQIDTMMQKVVKTK